MHSRIVLALALCASITAPSVAQVKDQLPASIADFSKEAYVVERLRTRITEETDGSGTRELTAAVKILSEAGVKAFAVLGFTYTSANEVVDVDYVRVRKSDGTVVKTPDYNIQDMPAEVTRSAPLYSDIHEKHVAVKGLGVGDELEYLVRFRVVKPQVPGHFWYEHSFSKEAIIQDEELEISTPADKYVKVVCPEFKPEIKNERTRRIYRWTYSNLFVKEKDPNEIPKRIPLNPSVQVTTFASWEDVGRWYGDLQRDPLEVTAAIQAKAAELTKGLKTDDEKMRSIYNFVSLRFHYIGLDFGIGRYQPHAADDVLGNGYGDCKDKHTLLASLLKAAGYTAWPALIHTQRKLDPEVPSPAQFNHVITVVSSGSQLIWLDTTPEVAPYRLLIRPLRNKQALVVPSSAGPSLMNTPEDAPFPQEQEFSAKGKLSADGTFTGHVEQSYRGDSEVPLRALFRQVAQSQWKEAAQGFSYGRGFSGDVSNVIVSPPEELDKPFDLSYDYVRKNYGDWENRQITPPLPPLGVEVTKESREKKPSEPILLSGPGEIRYRARIELPADYSAVPPSPLDLVEPYAEYHTTNAIENGVLTSSRRFVTKKAEVEVSEWEAFRKFGRAIGDDEYSFIRLSASGATARNDANKVDGNADVDFQEGNEALQRRDAMGAQELFEKVIKLEPDYHGAHFNLGVALAMQNKISEALTEFHREEEITPGDPRSYKAAASWDAFAGHSQDAMEEWRRLLKADPKNHEATLNLGRMLYQGGKYSDAADLLEGAVKSRPNDAETQFALGYAYLKLGQSEQAIRHIRGAAEEGGGPKHDPMMLNNVDYTLAENNTNLDLARQYAEEAMKELDGRSLDDVAALDKGVQVTYQLSLLWDTLGWVYFQSGDVTRSESFIHAAWLLGQDAIVGEHLGEIYEKQGKKKDAAHVYELALAAQGPPPFRLPQTSTTLPLRPSVDVSGYDAQRNEIVSHYEKLTGKKPSINESWRLPNGTWTKTASEQLSQMRTTNLGQQPNLLGSAEFSIVFAPGGVESVAYLSGEKSLKSMSDKLKSIRYQVEFPAGSTAKILRRAELSCTRSAGCMVVLLPNTPTKR